MKIYKEFYFENCSPQYFSMLSKTEEMVLNRKAPLLADYISRHFLDVLNFMSDYTRCKYEDWRDGFLNQEFGAGKSIGCMKILNPKLYADVNKSFVDYDGGCKPLNLFLAENMIDMLNNDFEQY
ncbi:hypothetical protein ACTOJ1_000960 [Shigella flexneri]